MTTTAPEAPPAADTDLDPDLTEITKLTAEQLHGVFSPANGVPFLLMKAIADPTVPVLKDAPVQAELDAAEREDAAWAALEAAADSLGVGKVAKAHRDFTMDERRDLAKRGHALSDGSYPIPDADALRRAAILARSGHGNVAGARALIARRAREMGVSNPLEKGPKRPKNKPARKATMDPSTQQAPAAPVDGDTGVKYATPDEVGQIVKAAVAEAVAPFSEFMAKVAQQPAPRGPATSAAPRATPPEGGPTRDELLAKAASYRTQAQACGDGAMAADYRLMASEAEEQAARLT